MDKSTPKISISGERDFFLPIIAKDDELLRHLHNIICRCNMTLFFNMLFANFDPDVPDLPNVNYQAFFDHVVPPTLAQSEEIWDLGLKLRVQVYNYNMYKDPQKDMISVMFP